MQNAELFLFKLLLMSHSHNKNTMEERIQHTVKKKDNKM